MGGRKAKKTVIFLEIRDAEGRIVTFLVFLEISLCASARGLGSVSLRHTESAKLICRLIFYPFEGTKPWSE